MTIKQTTDKEHNRGLRRVLTRLEHLLPPSLYHHHSVYTQHPPNGPCVKTRLENGKFFL